MVLLNENVHRSGNFVYFYFLNDLLRYKLQATNFYYITFSKNYKNNYEIFKNNGNFLSFFKYYNFKINSINSTNLLFKAM